MSRQRDILKRYGTTTRARRRSGCPSRFVCPACPRIVKGRRAVIKAIRLPDSGARTVNTLPVIYDKVLDVRDDQVSFGLDSMELHEVYAIRVEEV